MCGRFTQHLSWAELHALAGLIGAPRNLASRFISSLPPEPERLLAASCAHWSIENNLH